MSDQPSGDSREQFEKTVAASPVERAGAFKFTPPRYDAVYEEGMKKLDELNTPSNSPTLEQLEIMAAQFLESDYEGDSDFSAHSACEFAAQFAASNPLRRLRERAADEDLVWRFCEEHGINGAFRPSPEHARLDELLIEFKNWLAAAPERKD